MRAAWLHRSFWTLWQNLSRIKIKKCCWERKHERNRMWNPQWRSKSNTEDIILIRKKLDKQEGKQCKIAVPFVSNCPHIPHPYLPLHATHETSVPTVRARQRWQMSWGGSFPKLSWLGGTSILVLDLSPPPLRSFFLSLSLSLSLSPLPLPLSLSLSLSFSPLFFQLILSVRKTTINDYHTQFSAQPMSSKPTLYTHFLLPSSFFVFSSVFFLKNLITVVVKNALSPMSKETKKLR